MLLLDDQAHVVNVNRSLAGTSFASLSASENKHLHAQLHPGCDGNCRFDKMWTKAWSSLQNRDSIEWEVEDARLKLLLRLNLSNSPAPKGIERDRRRPHWLLTITDVTKHRREHELLEARQQALVKLLMARRDTHAPADFDEAGDTGNRLMAGFIREDCSFGRQLVLAQEAERRRIAADLHDGIAQTLSVVKYTIEGGVERLTAKDPTLDISEFEAAVAEMKGLVDEVRRIAGNLVPSMLEDFGAQVAIEWLCKEFARNHPSIQVCCNTLIDEADTPDIVKIAAYRVVQEALSNVAKHASARRVDVSVTAMPDKGISLCVIDDGIGIVGDVSRRPDGTSKLGLRSMRERVEATGGTFRAASAPGEGLRVCADWTVEAIELIR